MIELVDGLQRTTAIIKYLDSPLAYAPVHSLFSEESIEALSTFCLQAKDETSQTLVSLALGDWLQHTATPTMASGFTNTALLDSMRAIEGSSFDTASPEGLDIIAKINGWLDVINQDLKQIESVRVPLIVYQGDPDNVPTIFELINSQGIKLSKYEKFAAVWLQVHTRIQNKEVRNAVNAKYQSLMARGYEVAGLTSESDLTDDQFNLFEYLFGLGKVLSSKFDGLFPESPSPDDSPSVAFVLATVAHGLKVSQMSTLAKKLQDDQNHHLF